MGTTIVCDRHSDKSFYYLLLSLVNEWTSMKKIILNHQVIEIQIVSLDDLVHTHKRMAEVSIPNGY